MGVSVPEEPDVIEPTSGPWRPLRSGAEANDALDLAGVIARTHHEKFDGSGYPRGLSGTEIPLEGRIAAVADVFDALTSDRDYRPAWSVESAVGWMRHERGKHFDPSVLDIFVSSIDEVRAVRSLFAVG